jgi:hypothetical protein
MRLLRLLGAVLATGLLLSGCSALQSGKQSGVEACSTIASSMQDWSSQLTAAANKAASDPTQAGASVDAIVTSVQSARAEVTNADVGAALDKMAAAGQRMSSTLDASKGKASGIDQETLTTATADLNKALADLGAACTKF